MPNKRKRRGRAGYQAKYKRYASEHHRQKNKEAKQLRHELNVEKQKEKSVEITKLYNKVINKYKLNAKGKYALKRFIGTINKSRLESILDYSYRMENWFLTRKFSDNAKKVINSTKLKELMD